MHLSQVMCGGGILCVYLKVYSDIDMVVSLIASEALQMWLESFAYQKLQIFLIEAKFEMMPKCANINMSPEIQNICETFLN